MHGDHLASSYLELDKVKMMLGGQRRRSPFSLEKPLQTGQWELERGKLNMGLNVCLCGLMENASNLALFIGVSGALQQEVFVTLISSF